MKIKVMKDSVGFAFVNLRNFPRLYKDFVSGVASATDENTLILERTGNKLMERDFDDSEKVYSFFLAVMKWGGKSGNRVRGQVLKNHSKEEIVEKILKAGKFLKNGKIKKSLTTIISLKGLHISFGSKILRMLSPQQVSVYDSVLAGFLSYPLDVDGWVELCEDCKAVANELNRQGIKNQKRVKTEGLWLVADVEAVVFNEVQRITKELRKKQKG